MWLETRPDPEDPLRQGDFLSNVSLPSLKLPIPFYRVGQQEQMAAPAVVVDALVVSQCCDNTQHDYAAVVPVKRLGNLKPHQVEALLNPEPVSDGTTLTGYSLDYFHVEPLVDVIADPGDGKFLVAHLRRIAAFEGDCRPLLEHRVARMTVPARRLLRIKLGLFWSRAEEDDVVELRSNGLPPGLSPR